MKKILFIHPALVTGGAETVLLNYLRMMSACDDYETHVLFLEQKQTNYQAQIPSNIKIHFALSHIESEFFVFSGNGSKEGNTYLFSWFQAIEQEIIKNTLNLINCYHYDVIINFHSNLSKFESFLGRYDLSPTIKLIKWVHGANHFNLWSGDSIFYQITLNKYQHIITICEDMKHQCQAVLNELGVSNPKVNSIYNPLQLEHIITKANEANDDPLLNDDFIVQVARLDEHQKNHLGMIDIYAQLKAKGIKQKLYIIGDGPDRQRLQEKIHLLGLASDCLLLGEKTNPFPYMKAAKLFIHTANFEGLPTVLIESMTCGTPVVAFDCPTGPREILADGKYGGLIPMGDNDKFVETVYDLLTNKSKHQAYVDLLPESITRFDTNTVKSQICQLINSTIAL